MALPHRIAAGGIVFLDDAILLVRYPSGKNGSFLVAPGGGLNAKENVEEAITREVLEETGLHVLPKAVVMIEDLLCANFKMCKIWMTCDVIGGAIRRTKEAEDEGIIEVGWYKRSQLDGEIVFPSILVQEEWHTFGKPGRRVTIPSSRRAEF